MNNFIHYTPQSSTLKNWQNKFYLTGFNTIILAHDAMPNQYQVLPKKDQDK
jgi:hypothetical protein